MAIVGNENLVDIRKRLETIGVNHQSERSCAPI